MMKFNNGVFLITGGTGSFGNAVIKRLLDDGASEIRVFSRDEKKQHDMRINFEDSRLKFYLGDVRDRSSIDRAVKGVTYIFHAAAYKQVPSCEFFPVEATSTNVIGTQNVLEAAAVNGVKRVVCLSTDKAVFPTTAMGATKFLMEKVAIAQALSNYRDDEPTKICITRYGNVAGSRGSVIPLFNDQIRSGKPVTVTDARMTRFMMTLSEAVHLVLKALADGDQGDLFIQQSPACSVGELLDVMCELKGVSSYPRINIGVRAGEKIHEVLASSMELQRGVVENDYIRIRAETNNLAYNDYFEKGKYIFDKDTDYTSLNTKRMSREEIKHMLINEELI